MSGGGTASTSATIAEAAEAALTINLSALAAAIKDIAANPAKALIDGSGQLIIKDAAVIAKIVAYVPEPAQPVIATVANDLDLAAALEPIIGGQIVGLVGIAKALNLKLPPLTLGTLADNAGEQQEQDVQSSVGR